MQKINCPHHLNSIQNSNPRWGWGLAVGVEVVLDASQLCISIQARVGSRIGVREWLSVEDYGLNLRLQLGVRVMVKVRIKSSYIYTCVIGVFFISNSVSVLG